jgi:hypothetical protein
VAVLQAQPATLTHNAWADAGEMAPKENLYAWSIAPWVVEGPGMLSVCRVEVMQSVCTHSQTGTIPVGLAPPLWLYKSIFCWRPLFADGLD